MAERVKRIGTDTYRLLIENIETYRGQVGRNPTLAELYAEISNHSDVTYQQISGWVGKARDAGYLLRTAGHKIFISLNGYRLISKETPLDIVLPASKRKKRRGPRKNVVRVKTIVESPMIKNRSDEIIEWLVLESEAKDIKEFKKELLRFLQTLN